MDSAKDYKIEKEIHLLMAHRTKCDVVAEILAGYELPMLVKIAAKLSCMVFGICKYPEYDVKQMIKAVLRERKKRLDADFQWTDENRERFLAINNELYEACAKGWQEALKIAAALEKRMKRRDAFLKDYEIEIMIQAYPRIGGERDAVDNVAAYLGEETLRCMDSGLSHCHYSKVNSEDFQKSITIDKSMNWNGEYFNGEFDNDFICYPIHYMLDRVWSFADILFIRDIGVDVRVSYQYNKVIPKRTQED